MRDINSMRLNVQFKRIYSKGKSAASPYLVLYAKKTGHKAAFGITASKKIGNAVCRNRAKRRLRGLYRKFRGELRGGFDIIMVARAKTAVCSYEKLEAAFLRLAAEVGILNETKGQNESL